MPRWLTAIERLLLQAVGLSALLLAVSGCVTTSNSPERTVDLKKAEQTHVQAGMGYLRQRDKESARRHFLKAIDINSRSAGAHNGLALVYQFENNEELAEKHFTRALALEPGFSLARNNYAAFLHGLQRYPEAEKHLLQVVEDQSYERRDVALMNLGRTQLQLGKTDAAIKTLKQSLGINFRLSLAHIELADIYYARQDYVVAKHYFEQFSKLSRQTPRSLWLGIRLERHFGNKDKEASYALALKNLHPYSEEFLEYKKSIE
ncbi:MAG: type IV pilus biogenesis/stability protein PilW [Gammaproteobacteria bacterium]|uniref:type IV pilus biogenesis/stability protein PilW n=1 Tax=Pseudomaricurvus alcaniphilus TaxID=1166482 RepID=UPI001409035A|nr:type IV pilus biogenesis/stability protein PilW [Pseudomaricurvus alcaniphilus]MBR9911203.1 type IV pilus biogenesis/stability protein PilW [Gammaproteobacteria bacterium]NHN37582.1 type IV pilus biogenesis/stability protein PilW [Pseudomaricurvus alcaniphilus]